MKLLYALIFSLFMACCGSKATVSQKEGNSAEQEAAAALKDIYDDVFSWYNQVAKRKPMSDSAPDFDERYMSSDYKAVLQEVKKRDAKMEEQGFVGFFDYDHWVCGQDYGKLSMRVISVSLKDAKTCRAEVEISNLDTKKTIGEVLVKEDGLWKIDDFIGEGSSEKDRMRAYAAGK